MAAIFPQLQKDNMTDLSTPTMFTNHRICLPELQVRRRTVLRGVAARLALWQNRDDAFDRLREGA